MDQLVSHSKSASGAYGSCHHRCGHNGASLFRCVSSRVWSLSSLLLLSLLLFSFTNAHKPNHHHCIHDDMLRSFEETVDADTLTSPQLLKPFQSVSEQEKHSFLRIVGSARHDDQRSLSAAASTPAFQPIRIVFDLSKLSSDPGNMCVNEGDVVTVEDQSYTCSANDLLTATKREFIVSVLLAAIHDYFAATISVQRVVGNLVVPGLRCSSSAQWACCSASVPYSYRTEGVANADYVLHVTARPTTGATIAWALPCNLDQFGRPLSGQANFGPSRLDPVSPAARAEQIGTALHEMTHALVFSSSRFPYFRQPLNGEPWGYDNVVTQTRGTGGIWVSKIVTPQVVQQAKQQFNCLNNWVDAGLELENGNQGSRDYSSHWEKRLVMNEYMSATSSYDPVFSALTLALFEDSGWYQVNYVKAQLLPWGFLEGCGLAQSRCSEWNARYTCSQGGQSGCTADYNAKGYCDLASYSSAIPAGFQYFQDPAMGGRDTYADYCPFFRGYSNGDCRGIGRSETYANTGTYMEEVGPSSKCFQSTLSRTAASSSNDATADLRPSCYKVLGCANKSLQLSIGGKTVLCPLEGGEIRVEGYSGRLLCPEGNRLCQMLLNTCSGHGVLLSTGICECHPGYTGADCDGVVCPTSGASDAECGGSTRGTCDTTTGQCVCTSAFTGLSCAELVCPLEDDRAGAKAECSGHGTCDRAFGQCQCADGYSGRACECVPGCVTNATISKSSRTTTCLNGGTCDCTTGGCACASGFSGVDCATKAMAAMVELTESAPPVVDVVGDKQYKFFWIYLNTSTSDITFLVTGNSASVDVDLYASFLTEYPTSLSASAGLFASNYEGRDEIHLCGSLGVFPRGLNDSFRFCARPTSTYVQETPALLYLSVFGYIGGGFTLSIETDKCKNVDCSQHGSCGLLVPGVCTCDRYWSGDDCSVPMCGPDCQDLGTCEDATDATTALASTGTTSALRNTSECYGNGECRVTNGAPGCVCDEAYSFTNPTPAQALCKELLPSVASIRHFTTPFSVVATASSSDAYGDEPTVVPVNAWALFTLTVADEWTILVANLAILSVKSDTMLFVRKGTLPNARISSAASSASSSGASSIQFTDADGWTAAAATRKVVLSRATSTLSSGMYYIGVFNSPYAREPLSFKLSVNATDNCTTQSSPSSSSPSASLPSMTGSGSDDSSSYGVCQHQGTCVAGSSAICSCSDGYVGSFCERRVNRTILSLPSALPSGASATPSSSSSSSSSVGEIAFTSPTIEMLAIGDWVHVAFEINDTNVRAVQFRLLIANEMSDVTPVLPVLLVRGPDDDGFPTLFTQSQQDFEGISKRREKQAVTLVVDKACSFATSNTDCYKLALYNRPYSGDLLQYRLQVALYTSVSDVFPSPSTCGSPSTVTGDGDNCSGHGQCLVVESSSDAIGSSRASTPTCQCSNGWTGLRCNAPRSFEIPQLWNALSTIALLCTECATTFTLARNEVKMFRVPESLRDHVGLRIRVRSSASNPSGTTNPNVYVSETVPRSIYDFTYISASQPASAGGGAEQVVELSNASLSGHFWVVVFSDYPTSSTPATATETTRSMLHSSKEINTSWVPHRRLYRRHLTDGSSDEAARFELQAELFALPGKPATAGLLTEQSFVKAVFHWLFNSPIGIAVFVFSFVSLFVVVGYSVWRLGHAPENQDQTIRDIFGQDTH